MKLLGGRESLAMEHLSETMVYAYTQMFYANVRRANAEFSILAYLQKNVEDSFFFLARNQLLGRTGINTIVWNDQPVKSSEETYRAFELILISTYRICM